MNLLITNEINKNDKQYINDELYKFNLEHFPVNLRGRYEEVNLYLKDENGITRGGILAEVCWIC